MTNGNVFRTHAVPTGHEPDIWFRAAPLEAFPENGGACVRIGEMQIAVFNFTRPSLTCAGEGDRPGPGDDEAAARDWYACQNLCPHKLEMALSRGILGSSGGVPKVACPYHKATFDLTTGECLSADLESLATFPVRIHAGYVMIGLTQAPGVAKGAAPSAMPETNGASPDGAFPEHACAGAKPEETAP